MYVCLSVFIFLAITIVLNTGTNNIYTDDIIRITEFKAGRDLDNVSLITLSYS